MPDRLKQLMNVVSIHAFRGEGDIRTKRVKRISNCFNPRLPGGRRPNWSAALSSITTAFQSTPSGGKATTYFGPLSENDQFQSTPSGGKATLSRPLRAVPSLIVSIHAFRGEGDLGKSCSALFQFGFQSTPSGGKATMKHFVCVLEIVVSIHAFRGEGDKGALSDCGRV